MVRRAGEIQEEGGGGMSCEYCRRSGRHAPGCPNEAPPGDYLSCRSCGGAVHVTEARRLTLREAVYCEACYRVEMERLDRSLTDRR